MRINDPSLLNMNKAVRQKKSPLEGTNPNLETDTLNLFNGPLMLITYNGIKKVYVKQVDTYEIQTTAGIIHKTDVLYVLTFDAARKLDYLIVKSIITWTLARLGRNQEINGMNDI